ncbi:hypothetical protein G6F62_006910 [Rhizopus arrhizus]|nr:hypothetical protein G6F23_007954 [Rhizopus arrhizus]KAG1333154.1 hypothetical protein G6F62_006910 [Rhizopus arrhizus]KAG1372848.1 hypothetical protein G6F61_010688 [Rhizopus arrhizus]
MSSDEEDSDCPLCMEELDIADRNFRPCTCGYQICRFCWHHIKTNLNGRCPACRRLYSEQIVEFIPVSAEEVKRLKKEKKEKERQTREMRDPSRRQLSSIRVVQKNLVYVLGMSSKHAYVDNEIFRKFGRIDKVVLSKRSPAGSNAASVGIYVTFVRKEDASKAIVGLNGMEVDGKTVRASYGTTKYCTYYLRHMSCPNPNCMYLHEPGDDIDSYNKDTVTIGKHANTTTNPPTGSMYPNKRIATAAKTDVPKTSTTAIKPPISTPRTWAPIPKVVPIPPVPAAVETEETTAITQDNAVKENTEKANSPNLPASSIMKPSKSTTTKKVSLEKLKKAVKPLILEEETKPALPPTASWAKTQPAAVHENVITPTHFGPSLSDAAQTLQKPKSSSSKAKKEKKNKIRMVRLEEFEEAEREAKKITQSPKQAQDNISDKAQELSVPDNAMPVAVDMDEIMTDKAVPVSKEGDIQKHEPIEEEKEDMVEKKQNAVKSDVDEQNIPTEAEKVDESMERKHTPLTSEEALDSSEWDIQTTEIGVEKDAIPAVGTINEQTQTDIYNSMQAGTNNATQQVEGNQELKLEENTVQQDEIEKEKVKVLASLNEDVIKAFDSAIVDEPFADGTYKDQQGHEDDIAQSTDIQSDIVSPSLSEYVPSPLVAMERLNTAVEQEISADTPQKHLINHYLGPERPSMPESSFGDNRRPPMPPPGLAAPPVLPEWINRNFDPFNGQDPSLIAARRLQHSQRMMEASGLFGLNNGFPQHHPHPPPPPPPPVPHFSFHPNFNEGPSGFPHQPPPPPPFANMLAHPLPHHPMMRPPHPHQDMINMRHFNAPLPPRQLSIDEANMLRAEFNAMTLNGGMDNPQSRENLRALLPNVNISFKNQQKGSMNEPHQSHFVQRQSISVRSMSDHESVASTQNNPPVSSPRHNDMPFNHEHSQEKVSSSQLYTQGPAGQPSDQNRSIVDDLSSHSTNPDVRTEAQNFFGEFLRKAASSHQDILNKKEEEHAANTENPLMFQDPAIMSVQLTGKEHPQHESNQNTMLQILGGRRPNSPSPMMPANNHPTQQQPMDPHFAMNQQRMLYSESGFDERGRPLGNNMFMGAPPTFQPPPPPPQQHLQQQQQQQLFNYNLQQQQLHHQQQMFNHNNLQQQQQMFNHHGLQQQQQPPPPPFIPHFLEPSLNTMGPMANPPNPMMRPPMMLPHQGDRFRNMSNMHPGDYK